ncbi:alkaline phosphatase D family protein [Corynebacterium sp. A21]|uniref:alkaline phosphatase D family protein n=1 Tax=Corynebacterium sp. A21 TaxID=3457318 RepID=UPI003FD00CAA
MIRPSWFNRRALLRSTLALGVTAAIPSSMSRVDATGFGNNHPELESHHEPVPYDPREHSMFMHGVASGDPLPTSVMLWTRVTPSPEAVPGSGIGPDVPLTWEISTNPEFLGDFFQGQVTATAARDHTVHVDAWGLEPAQVYYYRFLSAAGMSSRVGRTQTAPLPESSPDQLRLAVTSCANYESGYFAAYSDIAERAWAGELDVVVHLGDYLYEYASGKYVGKNGVTRPHQPTWGLRTLADYRSRYGHYRRDHGLQAAHSALPWVVTWDDHEIANDAWEGGAENHGQLDGDWSERRDAAMQAYLEWLPIRGTSPTRGGHIYRSLRFGTLAELQMLDLRSYRSAPGTLNTQVRTDTERTIMGSEQFTWLSTRLTTTTARWNLIGTSVMISPLNLIDLDATVKPPLLGMTGAVPAGTPFNADQWDGFAADRARLLDQLAIQHDHGRTVFLTGDIHSEWAMTVHHRGGVIGAEMVCSSVNAPNVDDVLNLPVDSPLSQIAEAHLRRHNPQISHVDLDAHGYSTLHITAAGVEMLWHRVVDIAEAGSAVTPGHRLRYDGAELRELQSAPVS